MAVFGLPGGAEWLIIIGIIALLFVPGLAAFWFGYFMGRKSATPAVPHLAPSATPVPSIAQADQPEAPTSVAVPADPPVATTRETADHD